MAERTRHRQSSTSSSRSQTQRLGSIRFSNPDIFSDEFALESFRVGDGTVNDDENANDLASRDTQPPALAEAQGNHPHRSGPIRRSLGSKSRVANERHSSLLSRHDGTRQMPPRSVRAPVLSDEPSESMLYRSTSRASTSTIPRTQSPYQAVTGPSHPYAMYPQDTFIRTPSTATTSTVRPRERSYAGPTGPSQPYGMYPQNTVPGDEIGSLQGLDSPVPAGFPGQYQGYRRRLGTDAEDADDLIGPDGYTEPLPPYTRYPDDIPPKGGAPGPASILSAEHRQLETSEETLMNPFRSRESLPQQGNEDHALPTSPQSQAMNHRKRTKEETSRSGSRRKAERGRVSA